MPTKRGLSLKKMFKFLCEYIWTQSFSYYIIMMKYFSVEFGSKAKILIFYLQNLFVTLTKVKAQFSFYF